MEVVTPPPEPTGFSITINECNAFQQVMAMTKLFDAGECCDAEVAVGGESIPVSRMALGAASSFFKAAFTHNLREGRTRSVKIDPNLDAACVKALVRFAHTAELHVEEEAIDSCIRAADQLGFEAVLPRLMDGIADGVNSSNAVGRWVLGKRFANDTVVDAALDGIVESVEDFKASLATPAFLALTIDQIAHLLGEDSGISPTMEQDIYEALMAWYFNLPPPQRTDETLGRLIDLVHLPMLGADYLCQNVLYSEAVLGSASARHAVENAMRWLASPQARPELVSLQMLPRAARFGHSGTNNDSDMCAFSSDSLPGNVVLSEDGKRLERRGHGRWRGARFFDRADREYWRFRIVNHGPNDEVPEYFFGVAPHDVSLDLGDEDPEGVVGITFKGAQAGDEITFVMEGCPGTEEGATLHYWISLAGGRTELEWMDELVGALDLGVNIYGPLGAFPFVQIKGGTTALPVTVEIVDMPAPALPEVEW